MKFLFCESEFGYGGQVIEGGGKVGQQKAIEVDSFCDGLDIQLQRELSDDQELIVMEN